MSYARFLSYSMGTPLSAFLKAANFYEQWCNGVNIAALKRIL
jgi:hypothetical protein